MSRRIPIALSCGALALGGAFVAGCGSDNKKDSGAGAAATGEAAPATTTPSNDTKAGTVNVIMQNNAFAPQNIKVKVGEKIHWVNNDSYPHNVTATKGDNFKSKDINGGATFDYTADKVGKIDYVCTIHSGQSGTITVTG